MAVGRVFGRHIGIPEGTLALVVAAGLIVPFVPIPGDQPTRIAVRFWTADMERPSSFIVHTSANICRVLSALASYSDRATGEFVQIDCGKKADAAARQIRAERVSDTPGKSPTVIAQ
ncbi:MAG TPA: hypothetical protein VGL83_09470 [Stellaceae bacterium]